MSKFILFRYSKNCLTIGTAFFYYGPLPWLNSGYVPDIGFDYNQN